MPTSDQTVPAALITRSIWPVSSSVSSSCFSSVISQGISHNYHFYWFRFYFLSISRLILNCAEFILTKFIFDTECFFPPAWFLCLTRWEDQRLLIMMTPHPHLLQFHALAPHCQQLIQLHHLSFHGTKIQAGSERKTSKVNLRVKISLIIK